jgi:hypothetical protein
VRALYILAATGCIGSRSPVRGKAFTRYADGTTVPRDLAGQQFQVLVEDGADYARYPTMPLTGSPDGTFAIADVPDGPFWLAVTEPGYTPVLTRYETHDVELADDALGRVNSARVAQPTPVQIDATNLAPWKTGDALVVDCFGNGTESDAPPLMPALATNAIELHATLDWSAYPDVFSFTPDRHPRLMDPAQGDQVAIARISSTSAGGITSYAVTQLLSAAAPPQVDGAASAITGAFADVPATRSWTASVDPAPFQALVTGDVFNWQWDAGVIASPGLDMGPLLAGIYTDGFHPAAATKTIAYGDPFDPAWSPTIQASFGVMRSFHFEATHEDYVLYYEVSAETGAVTDSFTFTPGAASTAITLGGQPIRDGETIVVPPATALPLDFTVPEDATHVRVTVWHMYMSGDTGNIGASAIFETDHAPVLLPAELFTPGAHHAIEIAVTGAGKTTAVMSGSVTVLAQ